MFVSSVPDNSADQGFSKEQLNSPSPDQASGIRTKIDFTRRRQPSTQLGVIRSGGRISNESHDLP